jgi:hypothetical protein
MNTRGNAPGGHTPAIADWLQPLASPKPSGAFPRDRGGMPPLPLSNSLQLSTALYSSLQLSIITRVYLFFILLCLPTSLPTAC